MVSVFFFFFAFVPWLYQKGHLREMTGNGMKERRDDMQRSATGLIQTNALTEPLGCHSIHI